MINSLLSTLILMALGRWIWQRSQGWRHHPENVLWVSLGLMFCAFVLCAPQTNHYIGKPIYQVTNIAHMDDFFGHICFIASSVAIIHAAAYRLLPDDELTPALERWARGPAAVVAVTMLVSITLSRSTRVRSHRDFFDVPTDGWLKLYWLSYDVLMLYLIGLIVYLMLWLRRDPRSRVSAYLFVIAGCLGSVAIGAQIAHLVIGLPISNAWLWNLLITPALVVVVAAIWRLYVRVHTRRR